MKKKYTEEEKVLFTAFLSDYLNGCIGAKKKKIRVEHDKKRSIFVISWLSPFGRPSKRKMTATAYTEEIMQDFIRGGDLNILKKILEVIKRSVIDEYFKAVRSTE